MNKEISKTNEIISKMENLKLPVGEISDGYHTFDELYNFRMLYNACLFNTWDDKGLFNVHKSKRHSDGEFPFGKDDMFIVVATLPTGQISNHYNIEHWNLFCCETREKADEWDGHTAQDVADRLLKYLKEDRC